MSLIGRDWVLVLCKAPPPVFLRLLARTETHCLRFGWTRVEQVAFCNLPPWGMRLLAPEENTAGTRAQELMRTFVSWCVFILGPALLWLIW